MEFLNFGFMLGDHFWFYFWSSLFVLLAFGYLRAPLLLWSVAGGLALVGYNASPTVFFIYVGVALVFNISPLRALLVSSGILKIFKALQLVPKISETERTALEAGVVWIESELFSGKPNFKKILQEPYPELSKDEKEFLDKKIDELCAVASDWNLWQTREIPEKVWEFIRREKLFGMIIPKEHGGLGFSALAHSEVVSKLSTRSVALGVLVMVPNSLGPAELLLHYGTEAQKKKYLARLASGEEIPCFALTEPGAGSDAGSIQASGVIFKGPDGRLCIKVNWNKRWITLASISTLLGVAFRLYDPENLLGQGEDVGITCALIPVKTPGVVVGQRHDPLGVPFYNCPTQGHDVVIDLEDCVVGGKEGCGRGWTMLMDCLAAGRGISLPSQGAGAGKLATRVISAHATNRKQFGVSIGKLEGVEEALAKVVGFTYLMEACRKFTAGAIDKGIKPPVVTAIAKYFNTELMRRTVIDGMDILGGAGISLGPRNTLGHAYISTPIAITVEGANIMTRTLIIFGQGALRAHPYAYKEVAAIVKNDVKAFDAVFWGHIGHIVHNLFRSFLLSITRGRLTCTPRSPLRRYYQKLSWASASFAILADIAMGTLGGSLKTKGKITGRFADILGWMYLATSALRRFEHDGKKEDLPFAEYALNMCLLEIQRAFEGLFANLEVPGLTWLFRGPLSWWVRLNAFSSATSDLQSHVVAQMIQEDGEQRDRMTDGIYMPKNDKEGVLIVDKAFKAVKLAEKVEKKVRKAVREGLIPKIKSDKVYDEALAKGVITSAEYEQVKAANQLRWNAIQVDDFSQQEYVNRSGGLVQ